MGDVQREFQVFVKPVGARCNLMCSYCYYLERGRSAGLPGRGVMNDDVLEEYIHQHMAASDGKNVFFSWHGGEPTLAGIDFYRRAVEIEKRLAPAGCNVYNGIQTNGTLINDEWGQFMGEAGFYVGVSIDGPEEYHNSHRRKAGGGGTFEATRRGLDILRKYNVPHEILCVVNSRNVHSPLEVYRFFKDLGIEFLTFLPLVERKSPGSAEVTGRSVGAADFGRFLATIFDEWIAQDIGTIKVQVFEEALRTAFGQEHTLCIFKPVCGAVPVIEMSGDFYSCDHYVSEEYLIGNIMDRQLGDLLDDPRQKVFGEAKRKTLPGYCLECEVIEMCNGECPKNRFISTPDGEAGLNYLCEGYRYFFSHCRPFVNEVARVWWSGLE